MFFFLYLGFYLHGIEPTCFLEARAGFPLRMSSAHFQWGSGNRSDTRRFVGVPLTVCTYLPSECLGAFLCEPMAFSKNRH